MEMETVWVCQTMTTRADWQELEEAKVVVSLRGATVKEMEEKAMEMGRVEGEMN